MSNPSPSGIGAKFLLVSAAIIVILAGLKAAQSLISPFLLAIFFALILTPPLRWLKKKGLPDGVAILALSAFVFLLGIGIVLVFSNSLTRFAAKLPTYKEKVTVGYTTIDTWINNIADKVSAIGESIQQLSPIGEEETADGRRQTAEDHLADTPTLETVAESDEPPTFESGTETAVDPYLARAISSNHSPSGWLPPENIGSELLTVEEWLAKGEHLVLSPKTLQDISEPIVAPDTPPMQNKKLSLSDVIQVNTLISYVQLGVNMLLNLATVSSLVLIMLVFMLLEAARLPDKVKEAFGGRDLSNEYFKKIADDTWNYMKIKTIICFLTGLATTIGLWFLGVEYAILWGLLMFFLNYIPNIGQIIASVPPILLALIDGGVSTAILVTAWLVFVNTVFGIGVEPRFLEQGLGISSLVVLLSLIFWGWLLGPVGMFLSAPLTMVMKIVLQNDPKTRWIAVLLSNR